MRTSDHDNLVSYLASSDWKRADQGALGSVWHRGDLMLRIPNDVDRSSFEWRGLIERAAAAEQSDPATLELRLENWLVDVTNVKAIGGQGGDSISLEKGIALVTSARSILRTSATTSRGPRPQLGYQYSTVGDRITRKARMGHTRPGSYIIPILMPVEPIDETRDESQPALTPAYVEPKERRATRTMAQALDTIQRQVIKPAREPYDNEVAELIAAGVARETVIAIRNVLTRNMSLKVEFEWANGLEGGKKLPSVALFPADSEELLGLTAQKLRSQRRPKVEPMTGYIVEMRTEPTASFRLRTVRSGRDCEVEVDVPEESVSDAHRWFADREALRVEGKVERRPGRPLRVPRPDLIVPIRELQLDL